MTNVLIVDDHPVFRKGVRQVLLTTNDLVATGESSSVAEALHVIGQQPVQVILLDITLPGGDGLTLLKELKSRQSHVPVLILTMHAETEYAVPSLRAGAKGYLTKDKASEEIIKAIRTVVAGHYYISTSLSECLAGEIGGRGVRRSHEALSDREYQVFRMIAAGRPSREIAKELSLSVKTVGAHRAHILQKMKMRTNADLITYAVRHGLAD